MRMFRVSTRVLDYSCVRVSVDRHLLYSVGYRTDKVHLPIQRRGMAVIILPFVQLPWNP
jgi:hypothetical protein